MLHTHPEIRMKATFTDLNGHYEIERECGETLDAVMYELIFPLLRAAGYQAETIYDFFDMEGK
jgi:hypothetical protein